MDVYFVSKIICVFLFLLAINGCKSNGSYDARNEKRLVLDSDEDMTRELLQLRLEFETYKINASKQMTNLKNENHDMKTQIASLDTVQRSITNGSGSVYVRWGRNTCPGTAELVYKGFIGGNKYVGSGSGSNHLCLPSDPTWSRYVDGNEDYRGRIYGTEIDTIDNDHIFEYAVHQQDMPCAVCRTSKSSSMMIPAKNNCYQGWTSEYDGYLMANADSNSASSNYICMDRQPEFLQHGGTNDNEHILYLVEAQCGSLPCPPYVQGRELACVVCSK